MTDEQLIGRVQARDEEALVEIHRRYVNLVYSMAVQVLGAGSLAEEATQDVFLKLWQRGDRFDPARGRFTSWLLTVARHTAIDHARKRGRQLPPEGIVSLDEHGWLGDSIAVDGRRDADRRENVRSALDDLPVEQRAVIVLAYFGGLSQSEIAQHTDTPLGTVKTRMRLGMDKLRAALMVGEEETS